MEARAELLAEQILGGSLSKTRVRGLDFSDATHTEPLTFLTDRQHQSSSTFSCGLALDLCGFLQEDPMGYADGPNLYLYTKADPVTFVDPKGLACGPGPFGNLVIPDRSWGTFDFHLACQVHDNCYGTCGRPKSFCDKLFLDTMMDDCRTRRRIINVYCAAYATLYYNAVVTGGQSAYDSAQHKACAACPVAGPPPQIPPIPRDFPRCRGFGCMDIL